MRSPDVSAHAALLAALRKGVASAPELAAASGLSQRHLLRALQAHGQALVAAGHARRRRYALRRPVRGDTDALPVYAVDADGRVSDLASLSLLHPQGSFCLLAPHWPCEEGARDGWWDGLPYPLYDMRPQGYLGRLLARELQDLLDVAPNPDDWDDETIVHVLSRRGADCAGNLIVGEASLRQYQTQRVSPSAPLAEEGLAQAYALRAANAARLGVAGSSAGGEFPKFTATREGDGHARTPHVIVKFSGVAEGPATQRWPDLLVCEQLALRHAATLAGVAAPATRILRAEGRTFLESERFDRVGAHGRLAMAGLQSASMHLLGVGAREWAAHAEALARHGWLAQADVSAVERLWWFGRLIANTDMHLGNLAFFSEGGRFRLAPAFDMLPMAYAPLAGGEVPPAAPWQPPLPPPAQRDRWREACAAALAFWDDASGDARISESMRSAAGRNATMLRHAADAL